MKCNSYMRPSQSLRRYLETWQFYVSDCVEVQWSYASYVHAFPVIFAFTGIMRHSPFLRRL